MSFAVIRYTNICISFVEFTDEMKFIFQNSNYELQ